MRILFDISHPAHVNFFKHAIKRININKNHLVFVTCLRRGNLPAIVREEIEGVDITYIARHRDGTYLGYDIEIIKIISKAVSIPVVALGGARDYNDFNIAVNNGYASAVAAGSLFVYHGPRRAVLISFPTKNELKKIFYY